MAAAPREVLSRSRFSQGGTEPQRVEIPQALGPLISEARHFGANAVRLPTGPTAAGTATSLDLPAFPVTTHTAVGTTRLGLCASLMSSSERLKGLPKQGCVPRASIGPDT